VRNIADSIFTFDTKQFNKLFPFYILLNEDMVITNVGKSFEKLFPHALHQHFFTQFSIDRPTVTAASITDLLALDNQAIIIKSA